MVACLKRKSSPDLAYIYTAIYDLIILGMVSQAVTLKNVH